MNLPFLNKSSDKEQNFFISLLIKPYTIGAILFEEIDGKLVILASNEKPLDKDIDNLTPEELLVAADKVISEVEPSLPPGASVEKTIFSIPATWVNEGKITPDNLAKLKKVCEDLGLVPMGYLMSIEAIVHFLQKQEGAPISAIFVELAGAKVFIYHAKGGKIIEFKEDTANGNLVASVEGLLRALDAEVLPSKIILLDHEGSSSSQQKFLSHVWPQDIPFLHLPQVQTLEKGLENEATINGVAAQMDLQVQHDIKAPLLSDNFEEAGSVAIADDFGFLKEKDVIETAKPEGDDFQDDVENYIEDNAHEDVVEATDMNISYFKKEGEEEDDTPEEVLEESENEKEASNPIKSVVTTALALVKIPKGLPLPSVGGTLGNGLKLRLIVVVTIIIAALFGFSYLYYNVLLKADITVFADERSINEEVDVIFASNDADAIPIEIVEQEIDGDDNKSATGSQTTGEKAKGAVTLFNKTESPKTFAKGTVIIGPNNLEFELQEEVKVASTSSFSTSLSSAEGDVLASEFGTEYNLPSNSNFTVDGSSTSLYIGKNSNAINGGTKVEKTVVAEEDLEGLLESVAEKLERDALSRAEGGLSGGEVLLAKAINTEVVDHEFSRKEGEEAKDVGIAAKVRYSIGKYRTSDLADYIRGLSDEDIPDGYTFDGNNSSIDVADLEVEEDESISAKLSVNAIYVPNIKADELKAKIKGKSVSFSNDEIKKVNGVSEVNINFRNELPFFPKLIPNNEKNITIEFKN